MTTPAPAVVASGYNLLTDENWWRFADGAVRCLDAVPGRRESTYAPPNVSMAYVYRMGRDPYAGSQVELKPHAQAQS